MEKHPINQRRQRLSQHMRELSSQVIFTHKQFIQPLFVSELIEERTASPSLSDVNVDTPRSVLSQIEDDIKVGITKFLLFPIPKGKFEQNFEFNFAIDVVQKIKEKFGTQIWLASDLCLCSYTNHGHCGLLNNEGTQIDNDASVIALSNYALQLAKAGADCIAPSDMMDGRIKGIRNALQNNGLNHVSIMSYSAKFASAFYGPFRDVCGSSPNPKIKLKDRQSYQISALNPKDAIQSTLRDINEGADIAMVKPAMPYLDIVHQLSQQIPVPLAVYQVSGEYESIELMAKNGMIDREDGHVEAWTAMIRSGANIIISYAARRVQEWVN